MKATTRVNSSLWREKRKYSEKTNLWLNISIGNNKHFWQMSLNYPLFWCYIRNCWTCILYQKEIWYSEPVCIIFLSFIIFKHPHSILRVFKTKLPSNHLVISNSSQIFISTVWYWNNFFVFEENLSLNLFCAKPTNYGGILLFPCNNNKYMEVFFFLNWVCIIFSFS